jgi:RNA polymerase sigma factor (sigma-70 family)
MLLSVAAAGEGLVRGYDSAILVDMASSGTDSTGGTDTALVDLIATVARDRDRSAFVALFDHFAPRVKAYMRRLGADDTTAEDLVQEVMLTVWHRAHLYDRRQAALSTWIFTIARNKRIDVLRREQRPSFDHDEASPEPEADDRVEETVAAAEMADRLREAVALLPAEQADLLRICYFEDKSHRTIAEELGLPLGTVKSRLRLALAKLRLTLTELR